MPLITFRPADPDRDFALLADWFTRIEDEPTSKTGLQEYYARSQARIIQALAEDDQGAPLGFYWLWRNPAAPEQFHCTLFVAPERRGQGVGRVLYAELEQAVRTAGGRELRFSIRDNDPVARRFAERRGLSERSHQIAMALDLATFDDRPYALLRLRLRDEGFLFTSMADLGNTEAAQRKLFTLNQATARDIPGSNDEPAWASFEDFQARVCQADWYKPAGQMVVIDLARDGEDGPFVALSAITRFTGAGHAYNLHTGVARDYRGRKLAQAVKSLALGYARDELGVTRVQTHHEALNEAMIAIDRKFGYEQTPGLFTMQKIND